MDGEPIRLAGRRRVELLARLAVSVGQVVAADRLLADVWTEGRTATADKQLHIVISKLRESLGELIITRSPGYLLDLPPDRVDANRFSTLLRRARAARREGDQAQAAALQRQALELWRGAPLDGLAAPWARVEATRLEEVRAVAVEEYAEDLMALGEHAEAVSELTAHTAVHPLREHPRAQLMLALTLMGRPAEALEVYADARQSLVTQLGVEPGAELRRVHRAVLNREAHPQKRPSTPARQAPAQLPADASAFTARQRELAWLRDLLTSSGGRKAAVAAVNGPGGIGKSALVIHIAHSVAEHFANGVLYLNLHGSTPGLDPVTPAAALARMLRALGENSVPESLDEASSLFRTLTAERDLLIILDNAADVRQVRPLLPSGPGCSVLVTSRKPLTTLDAEHLHLAGLTEEEAVALLARVAGPDRIRTEPEAAALLARLCGGLPLAVRISGARLAARPDWRIEDLAGRLADERRRLDTLDYADLAVRASIAVSHRQLQAEPSGEDAATTLPFLGLLDLPVLTLPVAAELTGWPQDRTEAALDRLIDSRLLNVTHDAYQTHDLTRLYAREQAGRLPEEVTAAATRRVMHHYIATLQRASTLIDPMTAETLSDYPPERDGAPLDDPRQAAAWMLAERDNILALVRQANQGGDPWTSAALALSLNRPFDAMAWHRELNTIHTRALEVAARGVDHLTLARLRNVLGTACRELRQFEEALEHLLHGRDHLRQAGLPETTLGLHGNLVSLYRRLGRHDQALASVEEGLALAKARDLPTHEARYLAMRGQIYFDLQRFEESVAALEESVARWAEIGSPYGEAIALMNMADAHLELKQYDRAREAYRRGHDLSKITGLRQGEILALWGMGRAARHLGDLEVSMGYTRQSLLLMRELGLITQEDADQRLASLHDEQPLPDVFVT
ncbi:BTAD domain-containing putative transcriptional regulator [Nonomuraea sp. H19]|uniref:AfsR/SARP family transcriptional regulator n=1 Tax=Nonomuraea sp. H19 TaxID=3452206 RepID=UPI003F8CB5A6